MAMILILFSIMLHALALMMAIKLKGMYLTNTPIPLGLGLFCIILSEYIDTTAINTNITGISLFVYYLIFICLADTTRIKK